MRLPRQQRYRVSEILPKPDSVTGAAIAQGGENKIGRAWHILPKPDNIGVLNGPAYAGEVMPFGFGRGNARHGTAVRRAVAGGTRDGFRVLSPQTVRAASEMQWDGTRGLTDRHFRYGLGLFLNSPGFMLISSNLGSFGHAGAGDRCEALIDATYAALGAA